MDHFGIGVAVKGATEVYFRSGRRTGRTTAFVESLKDGDRIGCLDSRSADELRRRTRERGLQVEVIVLEPKNAGTIFQRGTSTGRTLFDHSWVEQYYREAIEQAARDIDHLQRESSGASSAHAETKLQAQEMMRWRG
jgi:hypothetical protein